MNEYEWTNGNKSKEPMKQFNGIQAVPTAVIGNNNNLRNFKILTKKDFNHRNSLIIL